MRVPPDRIVRRRRRQTACPPLRPYPAGGFIVFGGNQIAQGPRIDQRRFGRWWLSHGRMNDALVWVVLFVQVEFCFSQIQIEVQVQRFFHHGSMFRSLSLLRGHNGMDFFRRFLSDGFRGDSFLSDRLPGRQFVASDFPGSGFIRDLFLDDLFFVGGVRGRGFLGEGFLGEGILGEGFLGEGFLGTLGSSSSGSSVAAGSSTSGFRGTLKRLNSPFARLDGHLATNTGLGSQIFAFILNFVLCQI